MVLSSKCSSHSCVRVTPCLRVTAKTNRHAADSMVEAVVTSGCFFPSKTAMMAHSNLCISSSSRSLRFSMRPRALCTMSLARPRSFTMLLLNSLFMSDADTNFSGDVYPSFKAACRSLTKGTALHLLVDCIPVLWTERTSAGLASSLCVHEPCLSPQKLRQNLNMKGKRVDTSRFRARDRVPYCFIAWRWLPSCSDKLGSPSHLKFGLFALDLRSGNSWPVGNCLVVQEIPELPPCSKRPKKAIGCCIPKVLVKSLQHIH